MKIGEEKIQALYCGIQGINAAAMGGEILYKRGGAAVCLTLDCERKFTKKE